MAHNTFTPYPSLPVRSQLLTNPPLTVPPIDDLLSLEEELKALRNKCLSRVKKADNDIRTLEALLRKLKDKDKDRDRDKIKVKDKSKIKRETTETPDPHLPSGASSTPGSVLSGTHGIKTLPSKTIPTKAVPSKTAPGINKYNVSISGTLSKDKLKRERERLALLEKKKKDPKKKRKREEEDSDIEELDRHKKLKRSPEPPPVIHKQKSPSKIPVTVQTQMPAVASFTLTRHTTQIPQKPVTQSLLVPGPSSPRQVTEDFSKLKPPAQTSISTFWSYVEPWLRPIREEDVGLLEWDGDEEIPFTIPPLGRHYTEIWDDEDNGRYVETTALPPKAPTTASLPRWDSSSLQDSDLISDKGHSLGPIHERLLSAILPIPIRADGKPFAGTSMNGKANSEVNLLLNPNIVDEKIGKMKPFEGDKQPLKVNVQDMQERIVKELKSTGLLSDEELDYFNAADDPLAFELRQCQKALREQMVINKARRRRLAEIAKARLARNEFEEHVGALERSILAKYQQLQKQDVPNRPKKKKKSGGAGGGAHVVPDGPLLPPPHIHPAAWGMKRLEDDSEIGVDEELNNMILTRQRFVELVQPCLDSKEKEHPGLLYDSPTGSIYKGLGVPGLAAKGQ